MRHVAADLQAYLQAFTLCYDWGAEWKGEDSAWEETEDPDSGESQGCLPRSSGGVTALLTCTAGRTPSHAAHYATTALGNHAGGSMTQPPPSPPLLFAPRQELLVEPRDERDYVG